MCNLASHNTGCYEGTWNHCWTWACVRCAAWENTEGTWENKDKAALLQKGTVDPKCKSETCKTPSLTIFNPRNPRWKKGHQIGIYISGRGIDPGTGLIFQSVSVPLSVSTHRLFHSFHEEMESGPPPISAKTKNLFLALAETTAQTFMVTSCYVCGGTNMGDQWPWEAKELDPQRPSYNSWEFKQTRVRIWCLKDFHNQQKLPSMVGPITQVFQ